MTFYLIIFQIRYFRKTINIKIKENQRNMTKNMTKI
jgi:hypothetical protein